MWNVNDLTKKKRKKVVKYLENILKTRRISNNSQILFKFWKDLPPIVRNFFVELYKSDSLSCAKYIKDNDLRGPYIYSILSVMQDAQFAKKTKKGRNITAKLTKRGRNTMEFLYRHKLFK